jgi:hypothetical protein
MPKAKSFVFIGLLSAGTAFFGAAQEVPPPRIVRDAGGKPNWVNRAAAAYDRNYYVAETGYGADRQGADNGAFVNLTGFFGQSVQGSFAAVESYKKEVTKGRVTVQSGLEVEEAVARSAAMDQLIGAQIGDRWYDERTKTYWAVAFMEKPRAIRLYGELLDANLRLIETTLNMPPGERTSFDAVAKYRLAANMADANGVFATVLSLLGGPNRKSGLKTGDDYRYEAAEIVKAIPVNVAVEGDSGERIRGAFSAALSGMGFRAGGGASRYAINAKLSLSPVVLNNPNKFTRYVVDAVLVDTAANLELFPFSCNGREGHATQAEANTRALRAAEAKIRDEFPGAFGEFLSRP